MPLEVEDRFGATQLATTRQFLGLASQGRRKVDKTASLTKLAVEPSDRRHRDLPAPAGPLTVLAAALGAAIEECGRILHETCPAAVGPCPQLILDLDVVWHAWAETSSPLPFITISRPARIAGPLAAPPSLLSSCRVKQAR